MFVFLNILKDYVGLLKEMQKIEAVKKNGKK